ncbi:hypothetical protein CEXT_685651 [Caerostris extrusa]|uniref:Uncharacterized protein n=1 Tax=Caerostris extrusa TaxID=172846 RepID=A0AAV4S075_CAEEX|nr:hypothetical protein CEXT_685651 [Caerostris extrusa]
MAMKVTVAIILKGGSIKTISGGGWRGLGGLMEGTGVRLRPVAILCLREVVRKVLQKLLPLGKRQKSKRKQTTERILAKRRSRRYWKICTRGNIRPSRVELIGAYLVELPRHDAGYPKNIIRALKTLQRMRHEAITQRRRTAICVFEQPRDGWRLPSFAAPFAAYQVAGNDVIYGRAG